MCLRCAVGRRVVFVVGCMVLCGVSCSLCVVCCLLPFAVRCLLFGACCLLLVVCCLCVCVVEYLCACAVV